VLDDDLVVARGQVRSQQELPLQRDSGRESSIVGEGERKRDTATRSRLIKAQVWGITGKLS
jgi:hypothetical protein